MVRFYRANKYRSGIVAAFIKMHPEYATEMRMDTAINAFNLSIRDMADHICKFLAGSFSAEFGSGLAPNLKFEPSKR